MGEGDNLEAHVLACTERDRSLRRQLKDMGDTFNVRTQVSVNRIEALEYEVETLRKELVRRSESQHASIRVAAASVIALLLGIIGWLVDSLWNRS